MESSIDKEIQALGQLSGSQLWKKHQVLFGQPAISRERRHLMRQVAHGLQVAKEGGLSERARRRAAVLVDAADLSVPTAIKGKSSQGKTATRRALLPGTVLVRIYQGRTLQVHVLENGFQYDGQAFRSLTAVVRAITGSHWNGYHFFRLVRESRKQS